jgi:hypothetical protein
MRTTSGFSAASRSSKEDFRLPAVFPRPASPRFEAKVQPPSSFLRRLSKELLPAIAPPTAAIFFAVTLLLSKPFASFS